MKHIKGKEEAELEKERKRLERRKKKPKRQIQDPVDRNIAFNDSELDKYAPQEPVSKKAKKDSIKKLLIAVAICVLCGLIVFIYANRNKLSFEAVSNWFNYELLGKSYGEGFPVGISGTEIAPGNISMLDGKYLSYVSDTSSSAIKSDGSEIYNRQIPYSNPIMKTSGSYNLIYNLDGKGYQVSTAKEVRIDSEAENGIFNGAINSKGTYALLTKADGYLSKLSVYDNKGNLKYTYSFSEYYAYCVDINADGTEAVVGAVSSKDGNVISALYLLNFTSEEPKEFTTFDNSTIYSVKYLSDSLAAVICDNSFAVYNVNNAALVKNSYESRLLAGYCINSDTGCTAVALSRRGDGRMCDIDYYNSSGEKENTISTDLKVTSIDVFKDKIVLLSEGKLYKYSKSGDLLSAVDVGNDVKDIKLMSEDTAYAIGITEIRRVDLNDAQNSQTDAPTVTQTDTQSPQ